MRTLLYTCAFLVIISSHAAAQISQWGTAPGGQNPPAGTNFKTIEAGSNYALALRTDGTVVEWGANPFVSSIPAIVTNPSTAFVAAVGAGVNHAIALQRSGKVIAWGDNSLGQTNVPAAAQSNVIAISAGGFHNLALRADGTVVAWGSNQFGQTLLPPALSNVKAISAGINESYFLKADGTVVAAGPSFVTPPQGLIAKALAGGDQYALALKDDGTVVAWGLNPSGVPAALTNPSTAHAVGLGARSQALAVIADGSVVTWSEGRTVPPVVKNAIAARGGGGFSIALSTAATAIGFGSDAHGELEIPRNVYRQVAGRLYNAVGLKGDGTVAAWGSSAGTPPAGLGQVLAVAAGVQWAAALKSDGTVVQWGSAPAPVPAGLSGVVALAAGDTHVLALKSDGTVAAWGANNAGQINVPAGLANVVAVSAGPSSSLALKADGTIVGWGANHPGDIPASINAAGNLMAVADGLALRADGTVSSFGGAAQPPPGLSNVSSISGDGGAAAVLADGTAIVFGGNNWGQAGVPAKMPRVFAAAAGYSTTMYLADDPHATAVNVVSPLPADPAAPAASPAGTVSIAVSGGAPCTPGLYPAPAVFSWPPGTVCTVSIASTQAGQGSAYTFSTWLDLNNHVVAPRDFASATAATTYTASFSAQFQLTTAASPAGAGAVTPASGLYYDAGVSVPVQAAPAAGYQFGSWSGPVANASSAATSVKITGPTTVTANFGSGCSFALSPVSAAVAAAGGSGSFNVTTSPGCTWTATSGTAWLTVSVAGSAVSFQAAPDSSAPRSGTITVSGAGTAVSFTVSQSGASPGGALGFVPVPPCRIADTRAGAGFAGAFGPPTLAAGTQRDFPIPASSCAIPASALAYSLNVTVVPGGPLSFLTLWPSGQPRPLVSTLNSFDGRIVANAAIVPSGSNGGVSVYAAGTTDVVIDINGYFVPAGTPGALSFYALTPCRLADTRSAGTTGLGAPALAAGASRTFPILASACAVPASAQAYSLNATVVPLRPLPYLTLWPAGGPAPLVSTLNSLDGSVVANAAIVPAGSGGAVSAFAADATDLILDIDGYFAPPGGANALNFYTVAPCRISDTRNAPGVFGGPAIAGPAVRDIPVPASACGIPPSARGYSLNVTVVPPGPLSYLTAWPAGTPMPLVSTLNSFQGRILANAAIVPAGANGAISVYVPSASDVVVDINGYFAP